MEARKDLTPNVCAVYVEEEYRNQGIAVLTGNTQALAEAIGKGIADAGKEAAVVYVGEASIDALKSAKGFALGCPAMGAEVLEEGKWNLL